MISEGRVSAMVPRTGASGNVLGFVYEEITDDKTLRDNLELLFDYLLLSKPPVDARFYPDGVAFCNLSYSAKFSLPPFAT